MNYLMSFVDAVFFEEIQHFTHIELQDKYDCVFIIHEGERIKFVFKGVQNKKGYIYERVV